MQAQVEEDPTGGKLASTSGRLNGAPHKIIPIMNFHVGDTVTSLQRAALQPGGQEVRVLSFTHSTRACKHTLLHTPALTHMHTHKHT